MRLVLDASVVIDHLRTKKLASSFFLVWESHDFVISLVTVAELYVGKSVQKKGPALEELEEVLSGVDIITPTIDTVRTVGSLRARYQLSLGDAFIAALAIEEKLPVLTLDRKAFTRIKEITLYEMI